MNNKELIECERRRLIDEGIIFWDDDLNTKSVWMKKGYIVPDYAIPVSTINLWIKIRGTETLIKRPVNLYATYQVLQISSAP